MSRTLSLMIFALISSASTAPHASERKTPTPAMATAQSVVESTLVAPMAQKENRRIRFSRAMRAPTARRVRILDQSLRKDGKGEGFVTFAIDSRHGWIAVEDENASWKLGDITGCVYPDSGTVFVDRGQAKYPAALLLGKRVKNAPEHTCKAEPKEIAAVTRPQ